MQAAYAVRRLHVVVYSLILRQSAPGAILLKAVLSIAQRDRL